MRCPTAGLAVCAMLLAPGPAGAAEIDQLRDRSAVFLLNAMEILDESDGPGPLNLRIIRVSDVGSCATGREAQTCPRGRLLIAVAHDDNGPRQPVVWRTERHVAWRFVRWLAPQKDKAGADLAVFEATDCEAPPQKPGQHAAATAADWREVRYEIGVNLTHASLQRLLPDGEPPPCDLG